jgi:polysaccharide export outer membrane protein
MRLSWNYLYSVFILFFAFSCIPQKRIVYFQNAKDKTSADSLPDFINQDYEFIIAPFDVLSVNIQSTALDQESFAPFRTSAGASGAGRPYEQGAFVNKHGNITLPYLGNVKVSGLTLLQATDTIRSRLLQYVVDTSLIYVDVKILTFPVTVIGEVTSPGIYQAENEFMTITEILARAGEVTPYGNRTNIKLIRSNRQTKQTTVYRLDLTRGELIKPIIARLQPNDVLYVEPLRRKQLLTNVTPILGLVGSVLSFTFLIITLTNRL